MSEKQQIDPSLSELQRYEKAHNNYIKQIQQLDERMDELTPYEIAKLEYLYPKAERMAWHIAGWHKKKAKFYEGMAEITRGQEYKNVRKNGGSGVDGNYESRVTSGQMTCEQSDYEGDFIIWKGVAGTYERAANALKDVLKAIESQGGA